MASTRAFVVGNPIKHSRSPLLHGCWIKRYGLGAEYVPQHCELEAFEDFMGSIADHGFIGGNVTLPFKERAYARADQCTPKAKRLGAANTVWLEGETLWADNTDGYGFLANLDQLAPGWDSAEKRKRAAMVLGAGGAARAILCALEDRGFETIVIVNRTISKAEALARDLHLDAKILSTDEVARMLPDVGTLINTTSIGMGDGQVPFGLDAQSLKACSPNTLVTDIVYAPLMTPLLVAARTTGLKTADGLGMLMHQAVPGFERWFGVRPTVDEKLRGVLIRDLKLD